tara:strand:+ start:57 stop:488 length:432 start_codon:yes stop_codon:yes gene_type:complete
LKFFIINGPNLNLLGIREPELYGNETLLDIEEWLNSQKESKGHSFLWFQSNHEGEIIDHIHSGINKANGIIINPGAFTHYSYAIRDAIESVNIPTVEVHLSDIYSREDFRKKSVIKDVCIAQYFGLKKLGYLKALKKILTSLK